MKEPFFRKCKTWWYPGYYVPVRNTWNWHLDYYHLSEKEKEEYEEKFGQEILYDYDFENWYFRDCKRFRNSSKSKTSPSQLNL